VKLFPFFLRATESMLGIEVAQTMVIKAKVDSLSFITPEKALEIDLIKASLGILSHPITSHD
jgi:hypothetical protein